VIQNKIEIKTLLQSSSSPDLAWFGLSEEGKKKKIHKKKFICIKGEKAK
jgi:hypothetical protein